MSKAKRPVSEKQRRANRRNARRSTGPQTRAGKAVAARNTLTHGLTARTVVLSTWEESLDDFNDLLQALKDDLAPQGHLENTIVERIAAAHWRLLRAMRYETGVILGHRRDCAEANAAARKRKEQQQALFGFPNRPQDAKPEDEPTKGAGDDETADTDDEEEDEEDLPGTPIPFGIYIPRDPEIDRLVRYEGLVDRELQRAMIQLHRCQRLRHQKEALALRRLRQRSKT